MIDATIVILGGTGDLTKRKLIPALYHLIKEKKIDRFIFVGCARSEEKIKSILSEAKKFIKQVDAKAWKTFMSKSYYEVLDFYKPEHYHRLSHRLDELEKKHKLSGNRLFYLATLPAHFPTITDSLAQCDLAKQTKKNWARVVYEKPFGNDLHSAKQINKRIHKVFKESQVYRIDHYLGKELVGDIALIRFTNRILEPLWSRKHIESVHITMTETIGVGMRGNFYDRYGTIKDVIQNHALQLLALTAMEAPKQLDGESIRNAKAKVLKKTKIVDLIRGQYAGYRREKGVKKDSTTETFAIAKLAVNTPRFRGVPFYIKAGKFLDKKQTHITINFKPVHCLLKACPSDTNSFTIRIQPDDGFAIELNSKTIGKKYGVAPVQMDFCESCRFGPNSAQGYKTLLEDALLGDHSAFVRNDEIEYAWNIIDKARYPTVQSYKKGSAGPKDQWQHKYKLRWK